ncbi:hypothetical protein [Paractinoplanes lichenicola]|uniref:Uncharacterized protein n=1 Tax=Paractinoplanes lichenicola TaxID=2802976 RepID=A0ABS1VDR8_9ACTN|nr:hypothetical protein [Actinoplanes lichenicola]MBL7252778.1 hypothetical protein [Actinoplanes lichenicola]
MGMYASVRGWLEIDWEQRDEAERIITSHPHDLYAGGWAFPRAPFNWTLYLFYGGDIRQGEVSWLYGIVEELARMTPVDEDLDWPRGLFMVTAEGREGAETWQVREAAVTRVPAAGLSWLGE